jgi:hypothetical protein
MSRPLIPVLVLAALGIAVAAFLMQEDDPTPGPQRTETTTAAEEPAAAEPVEPEAADPELVEVAGAGLERVTLAPAAEGSVATYGTPAEEGIVVTVVDGESSEPMPEAQIMVLDTGVVDEIEMQAQLGATPDFETLFMRLGVTYRLDEEARVTIPEPKGDLVVAGSTPTHFNFAFDVDTGSGEVTLRLNPIEMLLVKVVDEAGRPVENAPVGLRMRSGYFVQDLMRNETDHDGIAKLKLFDILKTMMGGQTMYAALMVLTPDPVEAEVDVMDLPEEPPVLVMPEAGQVEVLLVDAEGDRLEEEFMVDLSIIDPGEVRVDTSGPDHWEEPLEHLTARGVAGRAFYPLVAYDQHLKVMAVSMDGERRAEVAGPGPVRGGGTITFTLAPKFERPILTGRILNTEGMAGANLTMQSRVRSESPNGNSSSSGSQIKTDEEGRFRMLLDQEYEDGADRSLTITMRATKRKPKREVTVDLSFHLDPGEHELGDLVVEVPPLIAAGMVVDHLGEPVAGADVRPERKLVWGDEDDEFYWNGMWDLRTESRRDGSFEIRGSMADGEYRIRAEHDSHLTANQEFRQGQEGMLLTMGQASSLAGRVLFDDSVDHRSLEVVLERTNDEGATTSQSTMLDSDGSYTFDSQVPGTWRLRVQSAVFGEELLDAGEILLTGGGGQTEAPDLDLRSMLTGITLKVTGADGKPVDQVTLSNPEDGRSWNRWGESTIYLVTTAPPIALTITSPGHRGVELTDLREDREVRLGTPLRIEVTVRGYHMLQPGWRLHASLMPISEDGGARYWNHMQDIELDEFGRGTVDATKPGPHTINFSLERVDPGDPYSWHRYALPLDDEMTRIDLVETDALQSFVVQLDGEHLRSTMERIQDERDG